MIDSHHKTAECFITTNKGIAFFLLGRLTAGFVSCQIVGCNMSNKSGWFSSFLRFLFLFLFSIFFKPIKAFFSSEQKDQGSNLYVFPALINNLIQIQRLKDEIGIRMSWLGERRTEGPLRNGSLWKGDCLHGVYDFFLRPLIK